MAKWKSETAGKFFASLCQNKQIKGVIYVKAYNCYLEGN